MALSKAERTRQFIIEKTAPVFNSKGYSGTSINDITAVTGLTKGSIYGNFENKDDVALAVFDYNFGKIVSYLRQKIEAKDSVIDKLLVYPEVYRNFLDIPFLEAGCPVLNTATEADDTHPLLRRKVVAALQLWKTAVENHLTKGIDSKEIKADTNITEFTAVLMCLIEGAVMQSKAYGTPAMLHHTMNYLERIIRNLKA
ncbi:TetR/AcrR family transcriptional regulator [Flavobacterium pallidum]|uniref:TetR/AcrR family transcriptional regulator n=1 Tax=Flavobacterium pallidum TaxID=2172098 RepID=A0A2S1SK59_9FLAO|nr:TetR/AcrR family transcriptional regulator [Flavobacterium pallidum]AWI26798.1 TetR/AcrR family transcriptional regulator [Flavobacterium pallidum]